jgi:hypothetical protein
MAMKPLQRDELLKDFIQEAVDQGATTVQQIHEFIADLPFEALERSGLIDSEKLSIREKQKRSIGMVYDAIRRINHEIGTLISDQFANLEDADKAARAMSKPSAKAASSRKPKARKRKAS